MINGRPGGEGFLFSKASFLLGSLSRRLRKSDLRAIRPRHASSRVDVRVKITSLALEKLLGGAAYSSPRGRLEARDDSVTRLLRGHAM